MTSYERDQYVTSTISIRNRKIVNFAFCPEAYKSEKKTERNSGRSTEPKTSVKNGPKLRTSISLIPYRNDDLVWNTL